MGILSVDLNNINLDDANFHEDDPKTIIHVRILAWHNKRTQCKAFKKEISNKNNACNMASNKMLGLVHTRR